MIIATLCAKLRDAGQKGIKPQDFISFEVPEKDTVERLILNMLVRKRDGVFVLNTQNLKALRQVMAELDSI